MPDGTGNMICGIEIHQQLDTHKLFCECRSELSEEGLGGVYRRLRPTTSEMGEVDRAALAQSERDYGYRYQCSPGRSCLVELDEEPPHEVNADAMETALIFSEMLGASVIDEVQFSLRGAACCARRPTASKSFPKSRCLLAVRVASCASSTAPARGA